MAGFFQRAAPYFQGIGQGLQLIGTTGKPQVQAGLLKQFQEEAERKRMQQQLGGLLNDPNLTEQQRGILGILPPEQGMGILAQQAFAPGREPVPGRDVPFSPEVLEQQLALRGQTGEAGGPDIGPVTPRDYTPESIAKFSQSGNYNDLQRYERPRLTKIDTETETVVYDTLTGQEIDRYPKQIKEAAAQKAEGTATGKYEGEKPILAREAKQRVTSAAQKVANLEGVIDQAIEQSKSGWTTGFWGSSLSFVGGTPQHDLKTTLETIQAIAGFQTLQEMRELSKTGGALGQVSNVEIGLLQNAIANVRQSQSKEQLQANLRRLKQQMKTSARRLQSAYKAEFGDVPQQNAPPPDSGDDIDALLNEFGVQ